jgi:hypothetical protein
MFDLWNPASGSLDAIVEAAEAIDAMRPAGSEPIQVVQRLFTEPPFVVPGLAPMTVDELSEGVRAARDAGVAHVVVDTGFTTRVESPDDWARFPDLLAPLLDASC